MDFKATSTNRALERRRATSGMFLPEAVMTMGIMGLMALTITSFLMFSGRSIASLYNYVDLNDDNRIAIDTITRDIRQSQRVVSATTNTITLLDSDGSDIVYDFSPARKTLTRTKNSVSTVILKDCEFLTFSMGQRNTLYGSYDIYPAATPATCKVINLSWHCTRSIFGNKENSESVQTARIVIRKQDS